MYTEFVSNKSYSEQWVVCENIITYIKTCVVTKGMTALLHECCNKCLETSHDLFFKLRYFLNSQRNFNSEDALRLKRCELLFTELIS